MDTLNPQEWLFIIAGLIVAIALYVKRDKVKSLIGGGGKGGGGNQKRK